MIANPAKLIFARSVVCRVGVRTLILGSVFALLAARADVENYNQSLRISEFLAVNDSGLQDVDGDFSDWIEIHNPTAASINLGGWYLTDNSTNKMRWQFPATNLNAGAFLVVFASDKNRTSAGAPLHTNFKLSGAGEYLGLVMPDGVTVASEYAPLFPSQVGNISYGLTPVAGSSAALVTSNGQARIRVPTASIVEDWQTTGYEPDGSWPIASAPLGYETATISAAASNVLFVVANGGMTTGDVAISNRLVNVLGCTVAVVGDIASQASDATGKQLVLVSSSASDVNVTNKFRDVAVPVINSDRSLVDDFRIGVVATATTSSNVAITAAGNGHAAMGGLVLGTNTIRTSAAPLSVATASGLAPGAQVLATANGLPAVILVESGQLLLNSQAAPARRMHVAWGNDGLTGVNATGLALFDATIRFCLSANPSVGPLVFAPLIATDVRSVMQHTNSSLLTRVTFGLPEFFAPTSLALKVRYDDGFVAWLNGVEIARRNAADPVVWNSVATTSRTNTAVLVSETLDVSAHLGLLNASLNVLAIQGMNVTAADGDFLLEAGLTAGSGFSGTTAFYTTPTPGSANVVGTLGIVPAVTFSHDRGYYTNAFVLTMTNALAGAEIRYTTNGTPPTASSGLIYTTPFTISDTTIIRAAAYKPGYLTASNVATMSYLFLESVLVQPASIPGWPQPTLNLGCSGTAVHDYEMDPRVVTDSLYASEMRAAMLDLPTLCLTVKQSDMWDASGNGGFYRGATEAPVSVELIYPGQPTNNVQADASVEGHSHDRLKRTLRLTFRASTGASRFDSLLFEGATLFGDTAVKKVNSIVLRGGNNRCWARNWNPDKTTYTEDNFYRSTQIALSGVGSHGTFTHLYINGLYWGIYEPVERPDNAFAASYLGGDDDDWFSINHGGSTNGLRTRWDYLTGALAAKDMAEAANYAELQGYLNVTNFIDYLLTCWYVRQNDWPGNNWWAASRNTPPGPASFFCWDGEWWFGSSTVERANMDRAMVHNDFVSSISSHPSTIPKLWHSARKNADFMMLCADRAFRHTRTNGALSDAKAIERWNALSNALHVPILAESARWGDSISPATLRTRNGVWNDEQIHIGGMLAGNAASLMASLRDNGYYPTLAPPEFNHSGGLVTPPFSFALTHTNGAGSIYFTVDGSDPRLPGGALNPSATVYVGAIPLSQSMRVQARVLDGSTWSALNDTAFALPGTTTLQPTELMYHAADPTPDEVAMGFTNDTFFEFLELKNTGSTTLALAGVRLTDGVNFDFPATNLPAGQILLLIRNQAGFESRYGTSLPVWGVYAGGLDNDGDTLRMRDAANEIVFNFRFEDHWQTNTDGGGYSLVPAALSWPPPDPATNSSWRASVNLGGSPGLDEPAVPTGFQAWKLIHFTPAERGDPAISGPDANPDGDRWANFTEYAFVTDPRTSGGELLPAARVEGGLLKVFFRRLKSPSDVAYRLEVATSLTGQWQDAGNEAVLQVIGSDATSETVEATFQPAVLSRTMLCLRIVALPIP